MRSRRRASGFTLIELLTVIAIIMLIMGLALPNFSAMMKSRRWTLAVSSIQTMVMRARALASNARIDMSVEFDVQGDNGTFLWLESESNVVETLEDLNVTYARLGRGGAGWLALDYLCYNGPWSYAGGRRTGDESSARFDYYPNLTSIPYFGDNARQSEAVKLGPTITVDPSPSASPEFQSWDSLTLPAGGTRPYGGDNYRDIRLGSHGALVQTRDPVICLKEIGSEQRMPLTVVRCTGRILKTFGP